MDHHYQLHVRIYIPMWPPRVRHSSAGETWTDSTSHTCRSRETSCSETRDNHVKHVTLTRQTRLLSSVVVFTQNKNVLLRINISFGAVLDLEHDSQTGGREFEPYHCSVCWLIQHIALNLVLCSVVSCIFLCLTNVVKLKPQINLNEMQMNNDAWVLAGIRIEKCLFLC